MMKKATARKRVSGGFYDVASFRAEFADSPEVAAMTDDEIQHLVDENRIQSAAARSTHMDEEKTRDELVAQQRRLAAAQQAAASAERDMARRIEEAQRELTRINTLRSTADRELANAQFMQRYRVAVPTRTLTSADVSAIADQVQDELRAETNRRRYAEYMDKLLNTKTPQSRINSIGVPRGTKASKRSKPAKSQKHTSRSRKSSVRGKPRSSKNKSRSGKRRTK